MTGSTSNLPSKALIATASSAVMEPSSNLLLTASNLRLNDLPPAKERVVFWPGLSWELPGGGGPLLELDMITGKFEVTKIDLR